MYESIRGTLTAKAPSSTVVDCGSLSYRLIIPLSTYTRLPPLGSSVELFLSQIIREDAHTLYAFSMKEERDLFELLLTVSGIGPRTACAIIGHMEIKTFRRAVENADLNSLSKIPGIGKKTAERLTIEMRDKFKGKAKPSDPTLPLGLCEGLVSDAIQALTHLGYHAGDAQKAVEQALKANEQETDLGRLITASLRQIN